MTNSASRGQEQRVNYQKASLLPLLMRFSIRYIIGSYIASIITPRAVLIGGGEAILKCVIQLPISRLAPSYFYLRPVCNKRAIQRSSFGPQSIIELAIEKGRNATSQGNSFVLVSFLLDAFLPLSCRYQSLLGPRAAESEDFARVSIRASDSGRVCKKDPLRNNTNWYLSTAFRVTLRGGAGKPIFNGFKLRAPWLVEFDQSFCDV
jgi:hypothetical protein